MNRYRYNKKKQRKKKSKFEQGIYKPLNEEKYRIPKNRFMNKFQYPTYRSSWEKKFYEYCDKSEKIEFWSTEAIGIPYISPLDGQYHRYFPDVFIKTKNGERYIVEIKPARQTNSDINKAKWEYAKRYADAIGAKFLVFTENDFKKLGIKVR